MIETIMYLVPSAQYNINLQATNQRPEMPNYSKYVSLEVKTKGERTNVHSCFSKIIVKFDVGHACALKILGNFIFHLVRIMGSFERKRDI